MFANIRKDYRRHGSLRHRGFWALVVYRFGVWSLGLRPAPVRWIACKLYIVLNEISEVVTGVVMFRSVRVGEGLHLLHPEGIRIHPDVVIGDRVGIMHRVTIGTNMKPGVPVIGNDVFIGSGAAILGPIKIGDRAHVAANSLVMSDVPPDHTAIGVPARNLRLRPPVADASRDADRPDPGSASPVSAKA